MKSWRTFTIAEVDDALERQQERQLARYEAEQDRLSEIAEDPLELFWMELEPEEEE
jgi:hypothetical protein